MAPTAKRYEALPNFCFVWDHIKFLVDDYTSLKCQVLLIQKFGFSLAFPFKMIFVWGCKNYIHDMDFWLCCQWNLVRFWTFERNVWGQVEVGEGYVSIPITPLHNMIFFCSTNFLPTLAPCYMLELLKKTTITNSRSVNEKAKGKMTILLGNYIPFVVDEAPHPIQSP